MTRSLRRRLHRAVIVVCATIALSVPAGTALVALDSSPDMGLAFNGLLGDYEDKGLG